MQQVRQPATGVIRFRQVLPRGATCARRMSAQSPILGLLGLFFLLVTDTNQAQTPSYRPRAGAGNRNESLAPGPGAALHGEVPTRSSQPNRRFGTPLLATTADKRQPSSSHPARTDTPTRGTAQSAVHSQETEPPGERQVESFIPTPTDWANLLSLGVSDWPSARFWRGVLANESVDAVWVDAEWLLWEGKKSSLPPLVTTDPNDGVLPDATILLGNESIGGQRRPGGRLRFGAWSNPTQRVSWEGFLVGLSDERFVFEAASDEFPLLARPFFNFTDDLMGGFVGQDAFLVADPGNATGFIRVQHNLDLLLGGVTRRLVLRSDGRWRVDLLAGYVATRIDGSLEIRSLTDIVGEDASLTVVDLFRTKNAFHGGQLGFELERIFASGAVVDFAARVGLGNMRQWVVIDGMQEAVAGGVVDRQTGGLLAQPTNIGTHRRDVFAVAPELTLQYRHPLARNIYFLAGYNFLYWNRVALPANQIDRELGVNPNQPPAAGEPQRPEFSFQDTDYYVHGLSLGLEWSF
ncbi:MAG: hypothetical protein KatS3mg110_0351 [Pirellulaceae bacterium]|nr:MAG: hypothetical protein KatS3mg110_0351 [Pirellulaceae bacterium]